MSDEDFSNIINLDERRNEARIVAKALLHIEVESPEPGSGYPGRVITCETVDFSANGFQIVVSEALLIGSILQLVLEVPEQKQSFRLTGEVRWVRQEALGDFKTGLLLFDSDGTEIVDWKKTMADWLS